MGISVPNITCLDPACRITSVIEYSQQFALNIHEIGQFIKCFKGISHIASGIGPADMGNDQADIGKFMLQFLDLRQIHRIL